MKKLFQNHRLTTNQFGSVNLVPFKLIGKHWQKWKRLQKILPKQWRQRRQGNKTVFVLSYLLFWPAFISRIFLEDDIVIFWIFDQNKIAILAFLETICLVFSNLVFDQPMDLTLMSFSFHFSFWLTKVAKNENVS